MEVLRRDRIGYRDRLAGSRGQPTRITSTSANSVWPTRGTSSTAVSSREARHGGTGGTVDAHRALSGRIDRHIAAGGGLSAGDCAGGKVFAGLKQCFEDRRTAMGSNREGDRKISRCSQNDERQFVVDDSTP